MQWRIVCERLVEMNTFCGLVVLLVVLCHVGQSFLIDGRSYGEKINARDSAANGEEGGKQSEKKWMHEMMKHRREMSHKRTQTTPPLDVKVARTMIKCGAAVAITRNNKLFVGKYGGGSVEVYDADTFRLEQELRGAGAVYAMASCPDCDTVYVAEHNGGTVIAIGDDGTRKASWSMGARQWGLSVNAAGNVLVTMSEAIYEYTSSGERVREITLQVEPEWTNYMFHWHAIQLGDDRYAVARSLGYRQPENCPHQVCIFNGNGERLQCYGGNAGNGTGQLSLPIRLVKYGDLLIVADFDNDRLVLLDASTLSYVGEIDRYIAGYHPKNMALNEAANKLYLTSEDCDIKDLDIRRST